MPCKNKESQAESARKHYLSHKKKMKQRAKEFNAFARKRNREYVWKYKLIHPCVDCKELNPIVLQFDHVTGEKEAAIANMVASPVSLKRLQQEIEKCEIRCANCHLKRHFVPSEDNFKCGKLKDYRM